jgi:hypothetical protein
MNINMREKESRIDDSEKLVHSLESSVSNFKEVVNDMDTKVA